MLRVPKVIFTEFGTRLNDVVFYLSLSLLNSHSPPLLFFCLFSSSLRLFSSPHKSSRESLLSPSASSWTESLLSSDFTEGDDYENQLSPPQVRVQDKNQVSFLDSIRKRTETVVKKMNLNRLFAPSTIAALRGFD